MKNNKQAMILAAGVGSRMDPLTQGLPKPLAPILGKPVMEHIITLCKSHGFTDFAANIHVKADEMKEHFKDAKNKFGINLNLVHETDLTGVAGGIRSCKAFLTDDVILILMGDAISDANLTKLLDAHKKSDCAVTIGIMEIPDTTQFGVIVTDENSKVVSFQEKPSPEEAKSNLANTGIYLFDKSIIESMPSDKDKPFYDVAKDLFPKIMSENIQMQAIPIDGYWADIGTLKQYQQSLEDAIDGKVKIEITATKTSYGYKEESANIDSSAKINGKAYIGKNTKIGKNVTLNGTVVIEEGCVIEDGAFINNSVIWSGSKILKNAKVVNSIIANNCIVNEGTELIANSAWAPASKIDSNSKPAKMF